MAWTRWGIPGAALAALVGIGAAGCVPATAEVQQGLPPDEGRQAEPAELAANDPPAPTHEDFLAVNAAPEGVWVSEPSEFDLEGAAELLDTGDPADAAGRIKALDGSTWARDLILCMRRFAGQAYDTEGRNIFADCNQKPTPWNSTDVMKVWDSQVTWDGGTQSLIIAFAGTRGTNIGDVLRDLQSQWPVNHGNPLDGRLPGMPGVGSGWDARWYWQAQKLRGALDWYIEDSKAHNRTLNVYVVGHSLGGVTATIAGYDIEKYIASRAWGLNGGWRVYVYAFNPPRLGGNAARDQYQDALFAYWTPSGFTCPAHVGQTCLLMRQFTRTYDPVQSVPVNMTHPVWNTPSPSPRCDHRVGPGKWNGKSVAYCTQINAPALSYWNPLENHFLAGWDDQIRSLSDAELIHGMFAHN